MELQPFYRKLIAISNKNKTNNTQLGIQFTCKTLEETGVLYDFLQALTKELKLSDKVTLDEKSLHIPYSALSRLLQSLRLIKGKTLSEENKDSLVEEVIKQKKKQESAKEHIQKTLLALESDKELLSGFRDANERLLWNPLYTDQEKEYFAIASLDKLIEKGDWRNTIEMTVWDSVIDLELGQKVYEAAYKVLKEKLPDVEENLIKSALSHHIKEDEKRLSSIREKVKNFLKNDIDRSFSLEESRDAFKRWIDKLLGKKGNDTLYIITASNLQNVSHTAYLGKDKIRLSFSSKEVMDDFLKLSMVEPLGLIPIGEPSLYWYESLPEKFPSSYKGSYFFVGGDKLYHWGIGKKLTLLTLDESAKDVLDKTLFENNSAPKENVSLQQQLDLSQVDKLWSLIEKNEGHCRKATHTSCYEKEGETVYREDYHVEVSYSQLNALLKDCGETALNTPKKLLQRFFQEQGESRLYVFRKQCLQINSLETRKDNLVEFTIHFLKENPVTQLTYSKLFKLSLQVNVPVWDFLKALASKDIHIEWTHELLGALLAVIDIKDIEPFWEYCKDHEIVQGLFNRFHYLPVFLQASSLEKRLAFLRFLSEQKDISWGISKLAAVFAFVNYDSVNSDKYLDAFLKSQQLALFYQDGNALFSTLERLHFISEQSYLLLKWLVTSNALKKITKWKGDDISNVVNFLSYNGKSDLAIQFIEHFIKADRLKDTTGWQTYNILVVVIFLSKNGQAKVAAQFVEDFIKTDRLKDVTERKGWVIAKVLEYLSTNGQVEVAAQFVEHFIKTDRLKEDVIKWDGDDIAIVVEFLSVNGWTELAVQFIEHFIKTDQLKKDITEIHVLLYCKDIANIVKSLLKAGQAEVAGRFIEYLIKNDLLRDMERENIMTVFTSLSANGQAEVAGQFIKYFIKDDLLYIGFIQNNRSSNSFKKVNKYSIISWLPSIEVTTWRGKDIAKVVKLLSDNGQVELAGQVVEYLIKNDLLKDVSEWTGLQIMQVVFSLSTNGQAEVAGQFIECFIKKKLLQDTDSLSNVCIEMIVRHLSAKGQAEVAGELIEYGIKNDLLKSMNKWLINAVVKSLLENGQIEVVGQLNKYCIKNNLPRDINIVEDEKQKEIDGLIEKINENNTEEIENKENVVNKKRIGFFEQKTNQETKKVVEEKKKLESKDDDDYGWLYEL